jgi:molybdopterin converting factor small subunit
MDLSSDFAYYLFRAGQLHAGHGPRATHVPEMYVTGSISLVNATFARFMAEEMSGAAIIPAALAAWHKILSLHLNMMLMGYRSGRDLDDGDFGVKVSLFGKMRTLTRQEQLALQLPHGANVNLLLQKFFNYHPQVRETVFEVGWVGGERLSAGGTPWFEPIKVHHIKPNWRVLLNGKDLAYIGGPQVTVSPGDEISIFPPGR